MDLSGGLRSVTFLLLPATACLLLGEVDLSGGLRSVRRLDQRLVELNLLGFKTVIIPEVGRRLVRQLGRRLVCQLGRWLVRQLGQGGSRGGEEGGRGGESEGGGKGVGREGCVRKVEGQGGEMERWRCVVPCNCIMLS